MMTMTREMLSMDNVSFCEDFVTTNADPPNLLGKFKTQMLDYQRTVVESKSINASSHVHLSGKHGGKLDDLSCTFQRAVRCMKKFMYEIKYAKYRK